MTAPVASINQGLHAPASTTNSSNPEQALPVLIAGAGLSGLTLANALCAACIPFIILERDITLHGRAQGYRLSLDAGRGTGGADGLKAVLSAEKYAFFEKSCGEECVPAGRVDAITGRKEVGGYWGLLSTSGWGVLRPVLGRLMWDKWAHSKGVVDFATSYPDLITLPTCTETSYQVDRSVLRSILLGPEIAPHVMFDAAVTSYTIHPNSVEAHLSDGRSIHGSLLVGADGIRSNVAAQLLADVKILSSDIKGFTGPVDLNVRVLYGKAPLTPALLERLTPNLHRGMAFVVDTMALPPQDRVLTVFKVMRFNRDISSEGKRAIGAQDVGIPGDYCFFAVAARKEIWHDAMQEYVEEKNGAASSTSLEDSGALDQSLVDLSGEAAADLSLHLARTRKWHPSTLAFLEAQDTSQTAVLRTMSSDPRGPPVWDTNPRVTLLGDAIHCMPPTGGQGGNKAIWDGAALGRALVDEWQARGQGKEQGNGSRGDGSSWSKETVRRYEDSMRANTGDWVGLAGMAATYLFGGEAYWR